MNSKIIQRAVVAAALLTLAACTAPVRPLASGSTDVRTLRADKEFDLPASITRVAIDNPWGEINIRGHDEREVGIHAVVQSRAPRYSNGVFRARQDGDTLRISIAFDGVDPAASAVPGRIDVAVFVPVELALALTTRDSRIAAKRRAGVVEAATDSGPIEVSSSNRLMLSSRSGFIRAGALGARWQGISHIENGSGRIVLLVPTFGDIALDARGGGDIRTNFGLSVHARDGGGHEAHARYGAGNSGLQVRNASGEIVLEQLVLLGEDKTPPEDDGD